MRSRLTDADLRKESPKHLRSSGTSVGANYDSGVTGRPTYAEFRALFVLAWALTAGGVLCAAASLHAGFLCFVLAGLLLLALGTCLAFNVADLSDRMVEEVTRRYSLPATSVTRVGGTVMAAGGAVAIAIGIVGLAS